MLQGFNSHILTPSIASKCFTSVAPRFLLIFAACLLSLLGKGIALASPFVYHVRDEHKVQLIATIVSTMFLPGLLLGLISCWHRGILKTFFAHPSILLMPVFTHFTFESSTKWCKGSSTIEEGKENDEEKEEDEKGEKTEGEEDEEPFIIFSAKFTILNLLISSLCLLHLNPVKERAVSVPGISQSSSKAPSLSQPTSTP